MWGSVADNSGGGGVGGTIYIFGGHSGFNIGAGTRIIARVHALRERVKPFWYFGNEAADVL